MSRKDFPKSVTLEEKAKGLSPKEDFFGFKCWYCDAHLIENGAKRAFVGINPGGKHGDDKYDHQMGYLRAPYEKRGPQYIISPRRAVAMASV